MKRLTLIIASLFFLLSAPTYAGTINVPAGGDLQGALTSAQPGDTIILAAGATFTGNFTLPVKTGSTSYITIQSSNLSLLPPDGQRVSPSDNLNMAKIVTPNVQPALTASPGSKYYKIIGIEFGPQSPSVNVSEVAIVSIGLNTSAQTSLALAPDHITLDRCYVHGNPGQQVKRGIALHSAETSVTNCYITDIHLEGQDSQGIAVVNGPGPFHIINNYVAAAAENIMFGGELPNIPNVVPSDIEVRHNYLYKPLSWRPGTSTWDGHNWSVKNLFEMKTGQRATIEGNVMENSWGGAWGYGAVNLTVRNDSGYWATLQHIVFQNNIVRNSGTGMLILGLDTAGPTVQGFDIKILNNLFDNLTAEWGDQYGTWLIANSINGLVIDHNTIFQNYWLVSMEGPTIAGTKMTGFVFTNNICAHGSYGFIGVVNGSTVTGDPSISTYLSSPTFNHNVIIDPGQHQSQYLTYINSAGSNSWPASTTLVNFVDYANHNYRLADNSPYKSQASDGKDIGADQSAIEAATGYANTNTTSTVVSDTFTGTSGTLLSAHTGEIGATWTKHPSYTGNAYISNVNTERGNANSLYYASGIPNTADYDVQADFVGTVSLANRIGIAGRINTSTNTYYRLTYSVPNSAYQLELINAGTVSLLQSANPGYWNSNFDSGQTHNVKLQMRGTSIKVFVDGVERISVTDSTITAAGRAGVYTGSYDNSDTWGIHIDTFTVTNALSTQSAQFVNDTFTGASNTLLSSHTGEIGATWTKHTSYTGNAYISNINTERGNANSLYYASGLPSTADYDVQADLVGTVSLANRVGIAGRINQSANTYYRVTYSVPNSAYQLELVNAGTTTLLQSANPGYWNSNFDSGQTHNVKLQMRGTGIKVFIDGVERISVTDSTITAAGRAGIYTGSYDNSDTWGIHIDNFTATNAP
jgi:hypothetical protein